MCRHCERIKEDVQHKQTVHDFMAASAAGVNRALREKAVVTGDHPVRPVTADDLEIDIKVTVEFWRPNPFASQAPHIIRLLEEMWK